MPWTKPSLTELRDQFRQDFIAYTETGNAVLLRRSVENILSYAVPGIADGLHGYINWNAKQLIPSEDSDIDSVLRWANDFLTTPQRAASKATGFVLFTGTVGTPISTDVQVSGLRNGATYATTADGIIAPSGQSTLPVEASEAGSLANMDAGEALILSSPVPGLDSEATVSGEGISGGADEETALEILERLRQRWASPPRAGGQGDYVSWALETPSIERAYELGNNPRVGWVDVVCIDEDAGLLNPSTAALADAQSRIDANRPIQMAGCRVYAPNTNSLLLEWTGLTPDDAQTRTSLEQAVDEYVRSTTVPGQSMSQPEIENVAQSATGVVSVSLSSPTSDPDPGENTVFALIFHSYV